MVKKWVVLDTRVSVRRNKVDCTTGCDEAQVVAGIKVFNSVQ